MVTATSKSTKAAGEGERDVIDQREEAAEAEDEEAQVQEAHAADEESAEEVGEGLAVVAAFLA